MHTIHIDNEEINLRHGDWMSLMIEENNSRELYRDYFTNTFLKYKSKLNIDSVIVKKLDIYLSTLNNKPTFELVTEFEKYINSTVKLTEIFNVNINEEFHSDLFINTKLKITTKNKLQFIEPPELVKNNNTQYQYNNEIRTLTVIQLHSMIKNMRYYQAIENICCETGIKIYDIELFHTEKEREKIKKNLSIISSITKDNYPNLYKLINRNIDVLKAMHDLNYEFSLRKSYFNADNNIIIYVSRQYLKEYLLHRNINIDARNISKILTFYRIVGLIQLVEATDDVINITHQYEKYKSINHYIIPFFSNDLLNSAEKISEMLISKKINIWKITYDFLLTNFGQKFALSVYYPHTVARKITKKG